MRRGADGVGGKWAGPRGRDEAAGAAPLEVGAQVEAEPVPACEGAWLGQREAGQPFCVLIAGGRGGGHGGLTAVLGQWA